MRYLIVVFLTVFFCGVTATRAHAQQWYEGVWVYDATTTHRYNPSLSSSDRASIKSGFDKWAGNMTVTPKRVKGKKAKLGVPYRVIYQDRYSVTVEVKGAVMEIVKAFNPDLRKSNLRCRIVRINHNSVAFDIPEMGTIKMYLRRVK